MNFLSISTKVKKVWLINRLIGLSILLILFGVCNFFSITSSIEVGLKIIICIFSSLLLLLQVFNIFLIKYQYRNYQYFINDKELVVKSGVVFKRYLIVPFIQVQDISKTAGPIRQIYKLADIIISTAGRQVVVLGLDEEVALEVIKFVSSKIESLILEKE